MTTQDKDSDEASAALVGAIVQMVNAFGVERAARVLGAVATDLKAHLAGQDAGIALGMETHLSDMPPGATRDQFERNTPSRPGGSNRA